MKLGIAILALVASSAAFAASDPSGKSSTSMSDWMVSEFRNVACDNPPCRRGCDNPPCRAACDNPPCRAVNASTTFPAIPDACSKFETDIEQQACADKYCAGKNDSKVCGPRAEQKVKLDAFKNFAEREKGKVPMEHGQVPRFINTFNKLWARYKLQNRDTRHRVTVQDFNEFVKTQRDRNRLLARDLRVLNNPTKDLDDLSLLSLEKVDNDSALKDTSNDWQTGSGRDQRSSGATGDKIAPVE
jgi:hypothetical protein